MSGSMSAELTAMAQLEAALGGLSEEERERIMTWALSRFKVATATRTQNVHGSGPSLDGGEGSPLDGQPAETEQPEDLPTFYDAASPTTDTDKALVAAYWIQFREGEKDVDAQSVNTRLKHLGYRITNVTRALEGLKSQKPALLVQTRKQGSTRQARKRFKVTAEGKKSVERMLDSHD